MDSAYFDQWYAGIERSARRQQLVTEALGVPPEVGPSNLVPLDGLRELARLLAVPADGLLADIACGRGGPGMWLARELGCRLVGVDFSGEAVRQASDRRGLFGLQQRASFAVGSLDATGLDDGGADAIVCIDAIQFAPDTVAALAEFRRIGRPGAHVVLTCWEAAERGDPNLPERLRSLDLRASLTAAGLEDVTVAERLGWREVERALWEHALATPADGDAAIESMHDEAVRVLPTFDRMRRVLATARVPL